MGNEGLRSPRDQQDLQILGGILVRQTLPDHGQQQALDRILGTPEMVALTRHDDHAMLAATYRTAADARDGLQKNEGLSGRDASRAVAAVGLSLGFSPAAARAAVLGILGSPTAIQDKGHWQSIVDRVLGPVSEADIRRRKLQDGIGALLFPVDKEKK